MSDEPIPPMLHFGHHVDTMASHYHAGFCGEHHPPPADGRLKEVPIRLHDTQTGREYLLGVVLFGSSGRQEDADMGGVEAAARDRWIPDDPRVKSFLLKYPQKLPHLGALQLQRECPVQLPYGGGMVVIPGDVEVVG